ncbi:MAG: hypothetical protein HY898_03170 [Deltaproteobacteria bacterium]|nr:hypothetical protein [Deltaproteobacteria bacterium]
MSRTSLVDIQSISAWHTDSQADSSCSAAFNDADAPSIDTVPSSVWQPTVTPCASLRCAALTILEIHTAQSMSRKSRVRSLAVSSCWGSKSGCSR